ncbi:UvrD-helicase domain-containing protein [Microbulbifer guangxiensis]|uniref:UvrD-helicase domain-containing protein n=1 Tax=Microbulbifer guangxiensis TaxID=2904249 RepID=UPI001F02E407|nr:UvrD-helicase domain-containing protein [Microbulbifer guangxiensis]
MTGLKRVYKPRDGFFDLLFGTFNEVSVTIDPGKPSYIVLWRKGIKRIYCKDISRVVISRSVSIIIFTGNSYEEINLKDSRLAVDFKNDLTQFVNDYLASEFELAIGALLELRSRLSLIRSGVSCYIARSDIEAELKAIPSGARMAIRHPLFRLEMLSERLQKIIVDSLLLVDDSESLARLNDRFVKNEISQYSNLFAKISDFGLSDEQREACVRMDDNNLLIAAAGSGKTATIVGKIAYVIEKGIYSLDQILVLAFNKKAAQELSERIQNELNIKGDGLDRQVMTFHSLGRRIITDVRGRAPQVANWSRHAYGARQVIGELISLKCKESQSFQAAWADLLALYPKADRPVATFSSFQEYQDYISDSSNANDRCVATLSGVFVRSLQEQKIANWLWMNSINFEYERSVQVKDDNGDFKTLHPDFYYPDIDTWHEHLAIDKNGNAPKFFKNYVRNANLKRGCYKRAGLKYFETTSAMAESDSLIDVLKAELNLRGLSYKMRSIEEVEKKLGPVIIGKFQTLMSVCVKHVRSGDISLGDLKARAKLVADAERARRFVEVLWPIVEAYRKKLNVSGQIDFESMIVDAIEFVSKRRYLSPYKLILVDEFQDISASRAKLLSALRSQDASCKLFAVGDDWQSIYRFAGSDIKIFTQFEKYFGSGWIGKLQKTYRCNQAIADAAAAFVQKNPEQVKKVVKSSREAIPSSIRVVPVGYDNQRLLMAESCRQVLERLNRFAMRNENKWRGKGAEKLSVLVLFRYNHSDPFKGYSPTYSHISVTHLTFHRAKGLEADYCILLDISEGTYGFPSRIEDDELVKLVFKDPENYPFAEERRLFYVALTRASRGAFLLTNEKRPSLFIGNLVEIASNSLRFETASGEPLRPCPDCRKSHLVQRSAASGASFLGCSSYPSCRYTENISNKEAFRVH